MSQIMDLFQAETHHIETLVKQTKQDIQHIRKQINGKVIYTHICYFSFIPSVILPAPGDVTVSIVWEIYCVIILYLSSHFHLYEFMTIKNHTFIRMTLIPNTNLILQHNGGKYKA